MLTDEEKRILLQNRLFAELPAERLDGLLQKLSSRMACFGKNSAVSYTHLTLPTRDQV